MVSLFKILCFFVILVVIVGLVFISIGDMFLFDFWVSYSKNIRE